MPEGYPVDHALQSVVRMNTKQIALLGGIVALLSSSACTSSGEDSAGTSGNLGASTDKGCYPVPISTFLGRCDQGQHQSVTDDGQCICQVASCGISGTLLDSGGQAHPELSIKFTGFLDGSYYTHYANSDINGNFQFPDIECTNQSWVTVESADGGEIFPNPLLGQSRVIGDSRIDQGGIALTVYVPDDTQECVDGDGKSVHAGDLCYRDPNDPTKGYTCGQDGAWKPNCPFATCTNPTGNEGDCITNDQGAAFTCGPGGTWAPFSECN
jgi:hypothetical protein